MIPLLLLYVQLLLICTSAELVFCVQAVRDNCGTAGQEDSIIYVPISSPLSNCAEHTLGKCKQECVKTVIKHGKKKGEKKLSKAR